MTRGLTRDENDTRRRGGAFRPSLTPPPSPSHDLRGAVSALRIRFRQRGLVGLICVPLSFEFGYDLLELFASHLRRGSNLHYTFPVLIASAARG
jgi:hypothetical protein